jgi:IS4 transposase
VVELIDWYRARWEIEIYFHVLKNGCEVETLQLGAIDRVERALALFMCRRMAHHLLDATWPQLPRSGCRVVLLC